MRLKTIVAAAALAAAALFLGGCPEPGNTITFWVMPNAESGAHAAWLEKAKAEFLKREGIVVSYEIVSWGDSWQRIGEALAAGRGPDVIQLRSSWNAHFAASGRLHKISLVDYGGADSFAPALLASAFYKGACFGVPWFGETAALACNRAFFAEAKAEIPRTFAELVAAGKKIIARRGRGAAVALPGLNSGELLTVWSIFLYGEGGRYVTGDGSASAFGGEAGRRAMEGYIGLYREGLAAKTSIESGAGESERLFARGKAAMCFLTPAGLRRVRSEAPGLELSLAAALSGPAGVGSSVLGANLAIPEYSPNKWKASRWIKFLLEEKNQAEYARELCAVLPAKKSALAVPSFREGDRRAFADALSSAVSYPPLRSWMSVELETSNALKLALLALRYGQYRPDMVPGLLRKAADAADRELAREAGEKAPRY